MKAQALALGGQGQLGKHRFTWRTICPILFLTLGMTLKMASGTECGHTIASNRVVGGKNSDISNFPWMASILHKGRHICGASLISESWLVTAAHCVEYKNASDFKAKMGKQNVTSPSTANEIKQVKKILIHHMYNGDGTSGDIAMMQLESPFIYTDKIRPICVPRPGQEFPDGMMCTLTGWGHIKENVPLAAPGTLQEVDLPLINAPACADMFKAKYPDKYSGQIHKDMICAGYHNKTKDGCQGDSGGPLACPVGKSWFLVGVVSWGIGCATPGLPGVYTKVSNFTPWINEKSGVNGTSVPETTPDAGATTAQTTTISTTVSPPQTKQPKMTTTLKPKQAAQSATLAQQSTTTNNGAAWRSSAPIGLLIASFLITKVFGVL